MQASLYRTPLLGPILAGLRLVALHLRSAVMLPFGFVHYWRTGRTSDRAYQSFVWLFCSTGGRSNDWLSSAISRLRPKLPIPRTAGVLGEMSGATLERCLGQLRNDGYVLFERALPEHLCDRLMRFALETPASVRRMDHEAPSTAKRVALFDASAPKAVRYDYATADLLDNNEVQSILADPSLLSLVQEYLGCEPVADVLSMWWHTSYHLHPDAEAAQFFHFDMDRIKWLKIFIYLSDVGPDNGPHTFVRGSHRTGGIPWPMLKRGYVRLGDDEVHKQYGRDDCLEFCAPRGSVIIEDTRGLHKGASVRGDPRLVLQLQFSNSLFGTNYPRASISKVSSPALARMLVEAPSIYKQYT